jgi:hypothetical protein
MKGPLGARTYVLRLDARSRTQLMETTDWIAAEIRPQLSLAAPRPQDDSEPTLLPAERDYWLSHCEGFQVDGCSGSVGVVEHVVFELRQDRPDLLAVRRGGPHRQRTVDVPVVDVVEIRPAEQRLVLGRFW